MKVCIWILFIAMGLIFGLVLAQRVLMIVW